MAQALNQYEAMFLLGPIGAQEPENSLNLCRGIIERHGGQILVLKKWDERKLTYEVGGQKRGTYIIAFFKALGAAIPGIERDVTLSESILRVIVMRADHLNEVEMAAVEPQPIQPREERPSYDRGPMDGGDRPRYGDRPDRGPRPPRREEAPEASAKE
jgi:small subunit ribosomal protein S6